MPAANKDAGAAFAPSTPSKLGSPQVTQLPPAVAANSTASAVQTRVAVGVVQQAFSPSASRSAAVIYNSSANPIYAGASPNGQANNYLVEPGYGLKVEAYAGAIYVYAPQGGIVQVVSS